MREIKLLSLVVPTHKQEKTIVVFSMFFILGLIQNRLIKGIFFTTHIAWLILLTALFAQGYLFA